jgi:hypothetical protein
MDNQLMQTKRNRTKGQTLHRKLNFEQHKPH